MIAIKPLIHTSFDDLYDAFDTAFQGYARSWTREELAADLQRRGYVAELSLGAFDDDKLVSFTLNATGTFNGINTAYDAGTGTIQEYHSQGLATRIFTESIPILKGAGVRQYLLEVIQTNTKAVSVYTKLGFKVSRNFNYFLQNTDEWKQQQAMAPAAVTLMEIPLPDKQTTTAMWDFEPSWQNSFESIGRVTANFKTMGAFINESLVGYGIIDPASGDIPQLAVSKAHRRQKIGSAILANLCTHNKSGIVKIINTDAACSHITTFVENNGIPLKGGQYEMTMDLS